MKLPKLEAISGEVVDVQLTTERFEGRGVMSSGKGSTDVVNRMRLFIKVGAGKERDFFFDHSTVGVRDGHTVCVVRGKREGAKDFRTIMLHNYITGQRMEIAGVVKELLSQKGLSARLRAGLLALVFTLVFCATAALVRPEGDWLHWALLAPCVSFPILWGIFAGLDLLTLPAQAKEAESHLRNEMEGLIAKSNPNPAPAPAAEKT